MENPVPQNEDNIDVKSTLQGHEQVDLDQDNDVSDDENDDDDDEGGLPILAGRWISIILKQLIYLL